MSDKSLWDHAAETLKEVYDFIVETGQSVIDKILDAFSGGSDSDDSSDTNSDSSSNSHSDSRQHR
ncbi:MAG: hypothetical protein R3D43_04975 [Tepidamorphaceae bacterium]